MQQWNPIGYRVLVKPKQIENAVETESGVLIHKPDEVVDQEQGGVSEGEVVALGPLAFEQDGGVRFWCKVGDYVMWPRYAGRPFTMNNKTYHVLNDGDILLKRKEE